MATPTSTPSTNPFVNGTFSDGLNSRVFPGQEEFLAEKRFNKTGTNENSSPSSLSGTTSAYNNNSNPSLFAGQEEPLQNLRPLTLTNTHELHDKIQALIVAVGLCSFIACTAKPVLQNKLSPIQLISGMAAYLVGSKYVPNLFIDQSESTSKPWTTYTLKTFTGYMIASVVVVLSGLKNLSESGN